MFQIISKKITFLPGKLLPNFRHPQRIFMNLFGIIHWSICIKLRRPGMLKKFNGEGINKTPRRLGENDRLYRPKRRRVLLHSPPRFAPNAAAFLRASPHVCFRICNQLITNSLSVRSKAVVPTKGKSSLNLPNTKALKLERFVYDY